jgi:hypothetical protein
VQARAARRGAAPAAAPAAAAAAACVCCAPCARQLWRRGLCGAAHHSRSTNRSTTAHALLLHTANTPPPTPTNTHQHPHRLYIGLSFGLLEPSFLLLVLFACSHSVSKHSDPGDNPNLFITALTLGLTLPMCAVQVFAALFSRCVAAWLPPLAAVALWPGPGMMRMCVCVWPMASTQHWCCGLCCV